jgi:hypothetical protein
MNDLKFQKIEINEQGCILQSNDSLFSTSQFRNCPLCEWSPLLASIFDEVMQGLSFSRTLEIPRVVTPILNIDGLFDCTFKRVMLETGAIILEWCIYDIKPLMYRRNLIQQKFNSWRITQPDFRQIKKMPAHIFEV